MKKRNKTQAVLVVKELAKRYGVTTSYVYGSLNGSIRTIKADDIRRDFTVLMESITQFLSRQS